MELSIGGIIYRLVASDRHGQWTAHAVRTDSSERFGIETTAPSEQQATDRLRRWLEWQSEHTEALEALQQAERGYHRAMADAAFGLPADAIGSGGSKASLELVNSARNHLDDVRARRPNV